MCPRMGTRGTCSAADLPERLQSRGGTLARSRSGMLARPKRVATFIRRETTVSVSLTFHVWRDPGRHREAQELLAEVYGSFTEGFDTPNLVEARAILGKMRQEQGQIRSGAGRASLS